MTSSILGRLYKLPVIKSQIVLLTTIYTVAIIFTIIGLIFPETGYLVHLNYGVVFTFVLACVIAPLAETFIYQYLPYALLESKLEHKIICLSLLSALFFGLSHYHSITRIFYTGFIGFCFQIWYILYSRRYGGKKAFLYIAVIHSTINFISFVLRLAMGLL